MKLKERALKKAHAVICVSHNTKRDLLFYYDFVDRKKVHVIHNGVDVKKFVPKDSSTPVGKKYVLFVGSRQPHKNFEIIIQLAKLMESEREMFRVVVVGAPFNEVELEAASGISNIDLLSGVTDSHLVELYQNASAFIYPSHYEGFGVPIIEAMACGCPVLLASNSCLPEVGGEAAVYFDEFSASDLLEKIRMLSDAEIRDSVRARGIARSKEFSAHLMARKTLDLYMKLDGDG